MLQVLWTACYVLAFIYTAQTVPLLSHTHIISWNKTMQMQHDCSTTFRFVLYINSLTTRAVMTSTIVCWLEQNRVCIISGALFSSTFSLWQDRRKKKCCCWRRAITTAFDAVFLDIFGMMLLLFNNTVAFHFWFSNKLDSSSFSLYKMIHAS